MCIRLLRQINEILSFVLKCDISFTPTTHINNVAFATQLKPCFISQSITSIYPASITYTMTRKSHLPGNNGNSGQTCQPLWGQSHSSTDPSAKEDAFWRNSHLPYPDKDKASQEGESTSPVCGLGSSKRQRQASQSQENSPDPGLIPDSQRLPPQAQQGQNLSHYLQHKGYIQGSESQNQRKNDELVAQQQPSSVWVQRGLDLFRLHGEDFLSTLQGIRCTNL